MSATPSLTSTWTKIAPAGASVQVKCKSATSIQLAVSSGAPTGSGTVLKQNAVLDFVNLAQDLWAAAIGISSTALVVNLEGSVSLSGLITSVIPAVLRTTQPWQYTDAVNYKQPVGYFNLGGKPNYPDGPAWDTLWFSLFYQLTNPSINQSVMTSISSLMGVREQAAAASSVNYDAANNRTTYKIQSAACFAQSVIPLDLRCVADLVDSGFLASVGATDGNPSAFLSGSSPRLDASGNPVLNPFSGSVNGVAYRGQVGLSKYGNGPVSSGARYILALYFQDTDGTVLAIVNAKTSDALMVFSPEYNGLTLPAGLTASSKTGSGTFSQTKGGQTLSGTYQPGSLIVAAPSAPTEADADPYFYAS